jgi:hypothetical protein
MPPALTVVADAAVAVMPPAPTAVADAVVEPAVVGPNPIVLVEIALPEESSLPSSPHAPSSAVEQAKANSFELSCRFAKSPPEATERTSMPGVGLLRQRL